MRSVVYYCGLAHYYQQSLRLRQFSEDELKEMEKYAAEMKVLKITLPFSDTLHTKQIVALLHGIYRSASIEDLTVQCTCECTYVDICTLCVRADCVLIYTLLCTSVLVNQNWPS